MAGAPSRPDRWAAARVPSALCPARTVLTPRYGEETVATDGCIFCRIVEGEVPARVVHEDEDTMAFRDVNPQAPVHLLVIPRRHVEAVSDLADSDRELAGRLLLVAGEVAREAGLEDSGYRIVANTGSDGGQTVPHLHLHVLGGRSMSWPPG